MLLYMERKEFHFCAFCLACELRRLKLFSRGNGGELAQLHAPGFVIYRHTSQSGERDAISPSQCVNERKHCHPE